MNLNDTVKVKLPGGIYKGKIVAIHKNYGFSKETKYEVHGKGFVTITSKRMLVNTKQGIENHEKTKFFSTFDSGDVVCLRA